MAILSLHPRTFLFLSIAILSTSIFAEECKMVVRVTDKAQPFYIKNEDGHWTGLLVDLADRLLKEANCKPKYKILPWARSLATMRLGQLDMMLNLSFTEERAEFIHFLGVMKEEQMIFVVKGEPNFKVVEMLDILKMPKKLGIVSKVFYGNEFEKLRHDNPDFVEKLDSNHHIKLLSKKLRGDRISAFVADRHRAAFSIKTDPEYEGLSIYTNDGEPFFLHRNPVYFGLSKKATSPERLKLLKGAYDRAKESGAFAEVLDRYQ